MPFTPGATVLDHRVRSHAGSRPRARRIGPASTDESLYKNVDFTLARGIQTFDAAFRLVHDQYVSCGYIEPRRSGRRLSLLHALPTTKVFVARDGFEVVGTLTLIQDSQYGLPLDDLYRAELARLREGGRRVAEISGLALHPGHRSVGAAIFLRLMRIASIYSVEIAGIDDVCIAVVPRHAAFYREFFDFEPFGGLTTYAKLNNISAVALRLDMRQVRAIIDRIHRGDGGRDAVNDFLYGAENYQRVMDGLLHDLCEPELTPECFRFIFSEEATRVRVEGTQGGERPEAGWHAGPPG